jgi:hypothetical protein
VAVESPAFPVAAWAAQPTTPTTVTLLRPPLLVVWSDSGPLTPPIRPAYLAASLRRAGHRARIVDGLGENPFQVTPLFGGKVIGIGLRSEEIVERIEPDTELVGVTCMFSQDWPRWNVRLTDSQNGFRAIRRSVAERLNLSWNVNTIAQEMVMKALKGNYRVGEVPSHEYGRFSRSSKSLRGLL